MSRGLLEELIEDWKCRSIGQSRQANHRIISFRFKTIQSIDVCCLRLRHVTNKSNVSCTSVEWRVSVSLFFLHSLTNKCATSNKFHCRSKLKSCKNYFAFCYVKWWFKIIVFFVWGTTENNLKTCRSLASFERYWISFENRLIHVFQSRYSISRIYLLFRGKVICVERFGELVGLAKWLKTFSRLLFFPLSLEWHEILKNQKEISSLFPHRPKQAGTPVTIVQLIKDKRLLGKSEMWTLAKGKNSLSIKKASEREKRKKWMILLDMAVKVLSLPLYHKISFNKRTKKEK